MPMYDKKLTKALWLQSHLKSYPGEGVIESMTNLLQGYQVFTEPLWTPRGRVDLSRLCLTQATPWAQTCQTEGLPGVGLVVLENCQEQLVGLHLFTHFSGDLKGANSDCKLLRASQMGNPNYELQASSYNSLYALQGLGFQNKFQVSWSVCCVSSPESCLKP